MKMKTIAKSALAGFVTALFIYTLLINPATFAAEEIRRKYPDAWFSTSLAVMGASLILAVVAFSTVYRDLATGRSFTGKRCSVALLVTNFIGAALYVFMSSSAWAIPEEHGLVPISGEPFVWAIAVFPIWGLFILLNLIWGAFIIARKKWWGGRFWLLTIPIWLVAAIIDFAHH